MVQEPTGQVPTTGETEPAAASQRHGHGQDDVVQEQLGQQRFEIVRKIVRRRWQRLRQQQQQNVTDDKRRWRGRWRHQFDGRQFTRLHRYIPVVQPAIAARRSHFVHQADTQRYAAYTTATSRVPLQFG